MEKRQLSVAMLSVTLFLIMVLFSACTEEIKTEPQMTLDKPLLSPPGGNFADSIAVEITCDITDVNIHYTINGDEPMESSALYEMPIVIKENTTLRARAFKKGWYPSPIAKAIYQPYEYLTVSHTYPTVGVPNDIIVTDQHILLAEDQGGFSIFNRVTKSLESRTMNDGASDFENIKQIGYAAALEHLYVYDRYGPPSLRIFDISDPASPLFINRQFGGELSAVNYFHTESKEDGRTFLAITNTNNTFRYGRIMPPDHATLPNYMDYSVFPTPNAVNKFHIVGNLVYLAAAQRGMYIFDMLSNTIIAELNLSGDALDIKVQGDYAYIATKEEGLQVVNIQNPFSPQWVSTHATAGWAQSLDIENRYLVLGAGNAGVYLFDLEEDPGQPLLLENIPITITDYVYLVAIKNGKLYTAGRYKGITEFNIR